MQKERWVHHQKERSAERTTQERAPLNVGGVESVIASVYFQERPHHRMAIKEWRLDGMTNPAAAEKLCRTRAEHAVQMYHTLRTLKIPVPTTYRLHESKPEVLMTDLSAGGTHLILTPNNEVNYGETVPHEILQEQHIESIRAQIDAICVRAAQAGVVMGADAYFIIFPKGNLSALPRVVVGDFGGCQQFQRPARHDEDFEEDIYRMSQKKVLRGMEMLLERYGPPEVRNNAYVYLLKKYAQPDERTIWER